MDPTCGVGTLLIESSKRYLNILYGRVLYVLQINENDKEFIKYRQFIENLKRQCKS